MLLMPKRENGRLRSGGYGEYNRQALSRQPGDFGAVPPFPRKAGAALVLLTAVILASCSSGGGEQAVQSKFGVQMARMNLWREALFRFERAVEMDPNDAMAHNNLAVAYEANGDFEKAAKQYREAMRLDRSNQYIQKNYSRFVEFTSRNRKREQRAAVAATAAETGGPSAAVEAEPASAPAPAEPVPTAAPAADPAAQPPPAPPPGSGGKA